MTDISVIIPVNDTRQLSDLFFTQWYEQIVKMNRFELIVITSNDEQFKFINYLYQRTLHLKPNDLELHFLNEDIQQSRAKAMNLGIKKSSSSLLYFFGDDFIPTKKTIGHHLSFHQYNPSVVDVGIGLAFIPDEFKNEFVNWLEVSGSLFGIPFKQDEIQVPPNFFYMANTSIKKEFVIQAGLFDEDFKYHCWDDWELGLRLSKLGMTSAIVMESHAIHNHDVQINGRFQAMQQAGESCKIYENKFPGEPKPWSNLTRKSSQWQMIKVRLYLLLSKITLSTKVKHLYFKEKMDLAFLLGYKTPNNMVDSPY